MRELNPSLELDLMLDLLGQQHWLESRRGDPVTTRGFILAVQVAELAPQRLPIVLWVRVFRCMR
jgi:hypothetical protein